MQRLKPSSCKQRPKSLAFGDTIIQFETKFEQALPKSLIEGRTDERPDTWVTVCTGHIGDTPSLGEGVMPWKECSVMDEHVRFVARLLKGEKMTVLCREFRAILQVCLLG